MAINPEIALSVKPLQLPDLAQSYGAGVQLRNSIQQGQLNAEKLKSEQRANQLADVTAADRTKAMQAFQSAQGKPQETLAKMRELGVGPEVYTSTEKHFADLEKEYADIEDKKLPIRKFQNDQYLGLTGQAIQQAQSDPQGFAQSWPDYIEKVRQINPKDAEKLDPAHVPNVQQLQALQLGHGTDSYFISQEEERRKKAAELRAQSGEARAAAKSVPELAEAQAKSAAANRAEDANAIAQAARQGGPPSIAAAIRQLPAERRAPFAGLTGTEKPEDILAIGTTPAEQVTAGLTKSRNQQTVENEKRLRDIAQGHLSVAQNQQKIAQNMYEQTYGAGANPALVGVEPKLRSQAATAAQKAADDYAKSVSAANDMKSFIDLARKGNKEAAAYMSPEGVLTLNTGRGVTRVNRQEMEAYGAAGSLIDHIQGKIGKLVSGQPIPPDVIKDIETLHQTLEGNAAKNYNTKLGGINQNYRSNFQPIKGEEKTATPSGVPEITSQSDYEKLPKGAKYTNNGVPHVKQ